MSKKIEITQVKSAIGYNKKTKATLVALGLKRINNTIVINDEISFIVNIFFLNNIV